MVQLKKRGFTVLDQNAAPVEMHEAAAIILDHSQNALTHFQDDILGTVDLAPAITVGDAHGDRVGYGIVI